MICARSEVGLSRLPVTEEIAGSNPVERATDNSPLDRVFFYGKYSIFIAFMCNLCYDIANWTEESKEFYNKIPDNVRERTPSVMVYNPNNINNPSGSETRFSTLLRKKALKGIAAMAMLAAVAPLSACGETHSEPTPDATSTSQETQDPTHPVEEISSPSPEVREIPEIEGLDDLLNSLDNAKDTNDLRADFINYTNMHVNSESAKLDIDEFGQIITTDEELPEVMKNIGEHSAYSINLMAKSYFKLVDEGRVEEADKMRDAYLSSMAIGHAQEVIANLFEGYKKYPETKYRQYNAFDLFPLDGQPNKIFESTGKDGLYPKLVRNNLNNADPCSDEGDLTRCNGLNYSGQIPKYQAAYLTGDGVTEIMTVVNTVDTLRSGSAEYLNFDPSKKQAVDGTADRTVKVRVAPVIIDFRGIGGPSSLYKQGSPMPFTINGKDVPAYEIPEIQKAWKDSEDN